MSKRTSIASVYVLFLASWSSTMPAGEVGRILFGYDGRNAAKAWENVNDGVMGGLSDGRSRISGSKTMEFYGTLSLENNGGFASVRSKPKTIGLANDDTIVVRVRGDGREYTLNLYVPTVQVAFSYRAPIKTKLGEWIEVSVPVHDFYATSFGRRMQDAGPVDAETVNSLGFLLGDKKAGPFKLEVEWIKIVKANDGQQQQVRDQLPPAPEGKTWKLVWHDEFDGPTLDESKWDVPENRRRDGLWSRKAISLDGTGNLAISTLKDSDRYLDGCVRTRGKFEHAHGYYVARIKLQEQPGHWSAFWLYNSCVGQIGDEGRDGTEIDIMEKPWRDDRVQHALHWDGYGGSHQSEGHVATVPGIMKGFHTFSLWWKADEYVFYVDGKETWRTKAGGVCQAPLYIKLSDEIGKWGGKISEAKLPDRFLTDYVRVYDLIDTE